MPTIDLSPIQGLPFSDARPYLEKCLGLSDRLDGASDDYAFGYLSRAIRMDLGKICSRGKPCGSSCVPRKSECVKETSNLAKEASAKARGKLIEKLKAERDKKRAERTEKRRLAEQKPPGGEYGSFPSKQVLKEARDRFVTKSGLTGNSGELPHEKATREKFEKWAAQGRLKQAIAEAETRLATGIDEDGDPIDEPMRRATERQLEQQKRSLLAMGGKVPTQAPVSKERLEVEALKEKIPNDTKRPKAVTREAAAEAVASLNRLYRSKIEAIAEASPVMRATLNFRAGRTYPDEPSTYYRGRIMGIRTKGDPHPTMTNESLRTAIEKSEKDMKYRLGKFVEEAYKVGASVPDDIAKEFPELADQYRKKPALKDEDFAIAGRQRPTQFKSRTGRTVSIDSLYSDRSDSFQRGYYLRMAETGTVAR